MEYLEYVLEHWPFFAVACVLSVIGQFTSVRIFTRERAYADLGKDWLGKALHWWFYWGRETLPLHPIAAGFLTGKLWIDPLSKGWGAHASMWYFAFAGFVSLGVWVWLKGKAKEHGLVLELPGETVPPPDPGVADAPNVLGQTPVGDKLDP